MRIKEIRKIEPKPSICIEVDSERKLFAAGGETGDAIVSHNSVIQRNIIMGCIMRPEHWRFIGIDLKRVELSGYRRYSNVVLGIATELEDALTCLRFAQATMMKRYEEMESVGKQDFTDMPNHGPALLVMVDEAGELLSPSGAKALAASTVIPTPTGKTTMGELREGDEVFDNFGNPTKVIRKYEPSKQMRYQMSIRSEKSDETTTVVAGAEHDWVAYFTHPDGTVEEPRRVSTEYLHQFKVSQDKLPPAERVKVRFKRG